jgi:hypothetical protein
MLSRSLAILGAAIVVSVANQPGWSQESKGTILGRITDSSGLVVPAATIHVIDKATTLNTRSVSNADGNYVVPFLVPGTYTITVEKTGFKKFVRDGIILNINDRLEINIPLELGAVSDTVTVTGEAPLLDALSVSSKRPGCPPSTATWIT